jgi:hypothetical protein
MSVGAMASLVSPARKYHYEEFDNWLTLAHKLSAFSLDIREKWGRIQVTNR